MSFEDMEVEYMSPRAIYWLKVLTGPMAWTEPMAYTAPPGILPGEHGAYKGVRIVERLDLSDGAETGYD